MRESRKFYDSLESKDKFIPILKKFIDQSLYDQTLAGQNSDRLSYTSFYSKLTSSLFLANAENVFRYCESPIERMMINSLLLLFLKNRIPTLFITEPFPDAEENIESIRDYYKSVDSYVLKYKEYTKDAKLEKLEQYLREDTSVKCFTEEEVYDILRYLNFRKDFEWAAYHITPQATIQSKQLGKKNIRVDFLVWVPNDPTVKIVIECDGYQYHGNKKSFVQDKIRNRELQLRGYQVVHYSGTEIFENPVEVSSNLFDILMVLDKNQDKLRMI